ncbi:MAG: thiamine phosphate synthase [Deltaproteobacteria bacterium]|nr:MAG: thiamine phosphate synthase [Deltaproteobacteria bacterium]
MDYSLYLVTDRDLSLGRSNLEVIEAAVAGGVTVVQLREKYATTKEFYEEGLRIRDFLQSKHIPLIINDRIDIALAVDADGVHVGQDDMPVDVARSILGPDKIIGASAFNVDEATTAEAMGADYLGLSPIFVTATKPELVEQIGIERISSFRESLRIPLVGIGSMNRSNVYEAVMAGLDGVAVVSAICAQEDPRAAAQAIRAEVMKAKSKTTKPQRDPT